MLPATESETQHVRDYMQSQAPDLTIQFLQKVHSENVLHVRHDVWDVHTDVDRWWVITQPMNLYPQDQFPNMDLAVTFHIGLCLRIPRTERQKLSELPIEPFAEPYRYVEEATYLRGDLETQVDQTATKFSATILRLLQSTLARNRNHSFLSG